MTKTCYDTVVASLENDFRKNQEIREWLNRREAVENGEIFVAHNDNCWNEVDKESELSKITA